MLTTSLSTLLSVRMMALHMEIPANHVCAGGDWAGQSSIFNGAGCPGDCVGAGFRCIKCFSGLKSRF